MFSAKNLGKRLFDEDEKNEEGNQPPDKKAKITLDDNNQSDVHDAEDNFNLLAELPDEMKVNVFSYCDLGALNALARTSVSLNELITGGVKGNDAVEHNIPLFNQPLTWREMPSQFKEKATAQWEEVISALNLGILSFQELKFNHLATNIKEFNEIENLLNEKNIEIILNSIEGDVRLTREINGTHLNLSKLRLTRFPLKQLLEDEKVKALFLNLTNLRLDNNHLFGPIPKELGQLTNLKSLDLYNNKLSGSIPSELGRLSKLEKLWLIENQLSGPIPVELGQLINLEVLILGYNQLSGPIPSELGRLSKLKVLELNHNQLSGFIPPELGELSNLYNLWLSGNKLSGSIPSELGQLLNLCDLDSDENQLSGPIPPELGRLFKLKRLVLGNNQLSGSIPSELGRLSNLRFLGLNDNNLSGHIPSQLGFIDNLTFLNLDNNQLSGPIPERWVQLYPGFANSEGHIAHQRAVDEEPTSHCRLRP